MSLAGHENVTVAVLDVVSHLPELLSKVEAGEEITLTEGGRPVARLVPFQTPTKPASGYGCMAGTFEITGDIVGPEPDVVGCMKGTFEITGDVISPEPDMWDAMQ